MARRRRPLTPSDGERAVVGSSDVGLAKPHREMFPAVAAAAVAELDRVVHVGNSLTTDIQGALNAGCRAVLFNPRGGPRR
jgi:HAD superfamily hydrolase (TIGR01549 family)